MKLTFDRRYDKWEFHRKTRERCNNCMYVQLNVIQEKCYVRSDKNENSKYALLWVDCAM